MPGPSGRHLGPPDRASCHSVRARCHTEAPQRTDAGNARWRPISVAQRRVRAPNPRAHAGSGASAGQRRNLPWSYDRGKEVPSLFSRHEQPDHSWGRRSRYRCMSKKLRTGAVSFRAGRRRSERFSAMRAYIVPILTAIRHVYGSRRRRRSATSRKRIERRGSPIPEKTRASDRTSTSLICAPRITPAFRDDRRTRTAWPRAACRRSPPHRAS
jgi:hypothetical protein